MTHSSWPAAAPLPTTGARTLREAPGPSGRRLVGSLHDVRTDRLRFVTCATREYGDVVGFRMGPKRLFLLRHPAHVRHVLADNHRNYHKGLGLDEARPLLGKGLLTSEGALWATQRRLMQAAFQRDRVQGYGAAIARVLADTTVRWRGFAGREDAVDVAAEMTRLALHMVSESVLSPRLMDFAGECAEDLSVIARWSMARMTALVRVPLSIPTPANVRARRALARLERLADVLVAESRRRRPQALDAIALLEVQTEAETGGPPPRALVRDEVMTLLLAGHETTAAVLSWTWHLLARHPEARQRLCRELDERLQGRAPGVDDLARLPYTRMVLHEALRLYPPVWLLPRRAIGPDEIGGYRIPAGSDVLVSIYSLQRHPQFWSDPDRFVPERFASADGPGSGDRQAACFLPFGAGPRTCIGMRLGWMEAFLTIAALAQRFDVSAADDRPVEPEASLSLHPRGGAPMWIRERLRHRGPEQTPCGPAPQDAERVGGGR